jgi:hypothetical protein
MSNDTIWGQISLGSMKVSTLSLWPIFHIKWSDVFHRPLVGKTKTFPFKGLYNMTILHQTGLSAEDYFIHVPLLKSNLSSGSICELWEKLKWLWATLVQGFCGLSGLVYNWKLFCHWERRMFWKYSFNNHFSTHSLNPYCSI